MMLRTTLPLVLGSILGASAARAGIEDYCTAAEQVGEATPSEACSTYLSLVAEVAVAAAPCWEQIAQDLPADDWRAAREQCEAQAHLAVCGRVPCY
jgi:hypothetical protein